MRTGHIFRAGIAMLPLALGACSTSSPTLGPPPLRPAPTLPVERSSLPPPPGSDYQFGQPGLPPPGQEGQEQEMASAGPPAPLPAAGQPVSQTDVLGQWTISSAVTTCPAFVTLTGWDGGYRASTRNCSDPALSRLGAWNIENNQVVLKDAGGVPIAVMNRTGTTRFDGQFTDGTPVSLVR